MPETGSLENQTGRALYKGALFDMDGLLLDTERICLEVFAEVVEGFGLPPMPEVILACVGLRADAVERVITDGLAGRMPYAAFDTAWRRAFANALESNIPLRPGALALLRQLGEAGIPCVVATSTRTEDAEHHLAQAGLREFLVGVVGGDQVENGKPHPEVYHRAAALVGVAPTACAAFEDSDPGTMAAIASGARVVQVPDIKAPSKEMHTKGHVIAPSLLEGARAIGLI